MDRKRGADAFERMPLLSVNDPQIDISAVDSNPSYSQTSKARDDIVFQNRAQGMGVEHLQPQLGFMRYVNWMRPHSKMGILRGW